jgi:Hint domain
MAYQSMTITQVSGGSITAADTDLTLSGNVTTNHQNEHVARTVTVQASSNGGTTWTNVGSFTLPAWDPTGNGNGTASQTWSGTITGLPAAFANVNDGSYVFRAQMPSERDATGTLTSSTSAAIPVDTTADAGTAATVAFADPLVNATEAAATSYTVTGLDADATAAVTFTSSGGGSPVVANVASNGDRTVNLSSLADGTISTSIAITDDAGANINDGSNTITRAGGTTTLDKTADSNVVVDLTDASTTANSASVAFNLINLDAGSTATVTFTGAGGGTTTAAYTTDGAKTADVSGLQGNVTAAVSVTDAAGNVAVGQGETLANDPVCFYPGTLVRTPTGEVAVETLRAGDPVRTADGRTAAVRWLGRQTVSTRFADPLRVLPVRVAAGALGEALPKRDLLLSPDHAILVDDVLVQAGALVNGTTIRREAAVPEVFTYWHVELADHALVLAEGVPAETFIDNVSRFAFDNWDEHEAAGSEAPIAEMPLPRAKSHRQVPMATRRRLAARAAAAVPTAAVAAA